VDLHGLTSGARPQILAYRPATVQMTWLGFPGTTGLPGVDYVIADEFLITPEMEKDFTEKPLRLPDTFQINDRQRLIGPRQHAPRSTCRKTRFVFCSFNNNFKFTPELFAHWMNILRRVPNSVLWLVADTPLVRENLFRYAEQPASIRTPDLRHARAAGRLPGRYRWPTCSSTPTRSTPAPPPATRCGPACRC
jgi:predicted O-linked N-acetylglucosamine transferase (SPINDLY family)